MASITYWNRVEARSRSNDLSQSLAARVHDPAWFLTRQWQLGEFNGDDVASPAFVRLTAELIPFSSWSAGQTSESLDGRTPLERRLYAEMFSSDDVTISVELGRAFERLLEVENATDLLPLYRSAYPIEPRTDDDSRTARLRTMWRDRVVNGLALLLAAKAADPALPVPVVPPAREAAARVAMSGLIRWADEVYTGFGTEDPTTWDPERLEYSATVTATGGETRALLTTHPHPSGHLDWYSFDVSSAAPPSAALSDARSIQRSVIPAAVLFRGMPQPRWWDFEDRRIDFGAISPDRRDLATLFFMDFMLVHGNDWFVVPFEQPLGTLCRVPSMVVRDVFGDDTIVPRGEDSAGTARWSFFSTTREGGSWADWFLVPPSAGSTLQVGPDLEDVRFLRDPTANMAWAVEHATEGRLGEPLRALDPDYVPLEEPVADGTPGLRYVIQSRVPRHWIPFVPVKLDTVTNEIALELASVLDPDAAEGVLPLAPQPTGRILQPSAIVGVYRLREEEIPREGTRVTRTLQLCRWTDGSTHLWVGRRRTNGRGEAASGLGFDIARVTGS